MQRIKENLEAFVVSHDTRKLFLIIYVGGAAIIALICGLFYFAVWVLAHFLLELYKRMKINFRLSGQDIAIALSHCKIDLTFFFVGLCIDVISHHSIAFALANPEVYMVRLFRAFKLKGLIRLAEIMPRLFGTVKASNCVIHLTYELGRNLRSDEEPRFQIKKSDLISLTIIVMALILTFLIPVKMGFTISEVFHGIVEVLSP